MAVPAPGIASSDIEIQPVDPLIVDLMNEMMTLRSEVAELRQCLALRDSRQHNLWAWTPAKRSAEGRARQTSREEQNFDVPPEFVTRDRFRRGA
jgi:hypothetical protein